MTSASPAQPVPALVLEDVAATIADWLEYTSHPHPDQPSYSIQYRVSVVSHPDEPGGPLILRYTSRDDLYDGEWIVEVSLGVTVRPKQPTT